MREASAPIEWVLGRSRTPWLLGFILVFCSSFVIATTALAAGLSWAGVTVSSPRLNLILQLAAIGIGVGPAMTWARLVPAPAGRLGVSAQGVIIDHGLRSDAYPWTRAVLQGNRLDVISPRLGVLLTYSLTGHQASRAAYIQRGAG